MTMERIRALSERGKFMVGDKGSEEEGSEEGPHSQQFEFADGVGVSEFGPCGAAAAVGGCAPCIDNRIYLTSARSKKKEVETWSAAVSKKFMLGRVWRGVWRGMENGLWSWIKGFGRWFQSGSITVSETTDNHPPPSRFEDVAEMFGACWDFCVAIAASLASKD
ncbi:hypothetical protein GGP41_005548 [Bipolaris sorokiniana]|uniref:Uncharacterized protein n=1 Tax=Cochliobolus sativus TaxID=45130 RepID=A0A8H5ZF82_COCSA|nr:hypothetical protein GGP41_005548 [Bipolaris sorokiniana]